METYLTITSWHTAWYVQLIGGCIMLCWVIPIVDAQGYSIVLDATIKTRDKTPPNFLELLCMLFWKCAEAASKSLPFADRYSQIPKLQRLVVLFVTLYKYWLGTLVFLPFLCRAVLLSRYFHSQNDICLIFCRDSAPNLGFCRGTNLHELAPHSSISLLNRGWISSRSTQWHRGRNCENPNATCYPWQWTVCGDLFIARSRLFKAQAKD